MKAGIGLLEKVPENTFVTNISGINSFHLCKLRWHNARNLRRIRPVETAHFLDAGTVGHDAIQDLHQIMGGWDSDAALGIAHKHAGGLRKVVHDAGETMSEHGQERRLWFANWLEHALPHYAQRYRGVPWEKEWLIEEPMWLLLDRSDVREWFDSDLFLKSKFEHVLLVGRPDAVVQIRGKLWHCQRKFFSSGIDLLKFVSRAPFMKHEVGYLKMIEALSAQGEFDGLPAGHTMFDLLRKLDIPQHPSEVERPAGCKTCNVLKVLADSGHDAAFPVVLAHHKKANPDWVEEHIKKAQEMLDRHRGRLHDKQVGWDNWVDRAFLRHEATMGRQQREQVWEWMLYDIGQMMAITEQRQVATPAEGWACNAYFTECPYVGVCAGRETLNGPQFADREDDYADAQEGEE
jgi:hypothetical protein